MIRHLPARIAKTCNLSSELPEGIKVFEGADRIVLEQAEDRVPTSAARWAFPKPEQSKLDGEQVKSYLYPA